MASAPVSRMALFAQRSLSLGEIALARVVFDDTIDYSSVRLLQIPPGPFGATAPFGTTIYFAAWRAAHDFAGCDRGEQGWLIHELAHIWQARRGVNLAFAKLSALGRAAYRYKIIPGRPLKSYNIEQQAEIARHIFHARLDAPIHGAPPRVELERVWPIKQAVRVA